ncbi:MAG TPA: zinc-binding alcohol dehydrogenase [Candidatus Limnocylindria bacterium]|nr:zinc-binding alcohol dehydrogenase [Candidatus Limnocylindria bacterium]
MPATIRVPGQDEVLISAKTSLISAGTEMLVYRGEATPGDLLPPNAGGTFGFPVKYGYQVVGRVESAGTRSRLRPRDRVFARHPHQERFVTKAGDTWVTPLPDSVSDDEAAFLNLARVALTANLDVPVRIGETALVFGQGVVGVCCALVARRSAHRVIVVDPIALRRDFAIRHGADAAVAPDEAVAAVRELTHGRGADVTFEASGSAAALACAVELTTPCGTVVILSYYGTKLVPLPEAFSRNAPRLVSSLAGAQRRWDQLRRTEATLDLLPTLPVTELISARVPFRDAPRAYEMVDRKRDEILGVLLDY